MKIDAHTELYGVVGHPLGHTLSPAMQNAAFTDAGLNAVYLAFETVDISAFISAVRALGIKGVSVTVPHKQAVIPLLDDMDPLAKKIGAVNTVINDKGRLVGHNTDALGAQFALEAKTDLAGKQCLVIGAGGAARAIGFMLKQQGAHLSVANRSIARGEALARDLSAAFISLATAHTIEADIVIQTTPVGMHPHPDTCPISVDALKSGMTVMDIIYNPMETKLLAYAKQRGCRVINGLSMFVHQGAAQFKLWTGKDAPIRVMRTAVETALKKNREKTPEVIR